MKADTDTIVKLASTPDALVAYLAACEASEHVVHETPAEAATRKARPTNTRKPRNTATAPSGPKASSARQPRQAVNVWTVRESWKGQAPNPNTVGKCLFYGMKATQLEKLQGDKFALLLACGNHLVKNATPIKKLDGKPFVKVEVIA